MVMSMPVLPDCPCGGQVVLDVGEDGVWEVCVRCGSAHRPMPPVGWQAYWREQVQHHVAQRKGKAS